MAKSIKPYDFHGILSSLTAWSCAYLVIELSSHMYANSISSSAPWASFLLLFCTKHTYQRRRVFGTCHGHHLNQENGRYGALEDWRTKYISLRFDNWLWCRWLILVIIYFGVGTWRHSPPFPFFATMYGFLDMHYPGYRFWVEWMQENTRTILVILLFIYDGMIWAIRRELRRCNWDRQYCLIKFINKYLLSPFKYDTFACALLQLTARASALMVSDKSTTTWPLFCSFSFPCPRS